MEVLNEVEDLFEKLEAVPVDVKEAALRKIVEKLCSAGGKKKKVPSMQRRRPAKRRRKEDKNEQRDDIQVWGSESHNSDFIVENILTSRGRKAQRICYIHMKQQGPLELMKRNSLSAQQVISVPEDRNSNEAENARHISNEDLVANEIGDMRNIKDVSNLVVKTKSLISELDGDVEDVDREMKLEASCEESQLVIVDTDAQESTEENNDAGVLVPSASNTIGKRNGKFKKANEEMKNFTNNNREKLKEEEEILQCNECSFLTRNQILFQSHMRKHVGLRPHKCQDCGKTFPQASALRIHIKRHRGQRDFPCDYGCNYRAYTKVDKLRHMTLHTGERCHQCQYCGKAFTKDSTLHEHVKGVHERPNKHICATCGFSTYRANNLRVHISMRHRGEYNNHVCPVCGAKVKQRAAFLDHMRSHTGERPYKCQLCESSFTCVARLTVHRKAVHGPREFTCKHCQKSFQTKHHMERHELIHTNQRPYSCPFCCYSCNTQGNVTKHVKGVHNKPDFSYRKFKADQQVDSDCKAVKSEWIEKGEKLTTEYLKDLSKKLGREVTLLELKEREAEKNKRVTEDEQVKKRRCRKQEHDYHSKVGPEDDERLEEEADEPTAVLLSVAQEPTSSSRGNMMGNPIPGLSQAHVLQGVTINRSPNGQRTLFIQTPQDTDIQSVLSDKVQKSSNTEPPLISGQNSIQFCVNEQMPVDDQVPLHVIYHSTPQQLANNSQEHVSSNLSSSKYINNFNFVEVKGDATSNPTVVVIINTDSH